MAVFYFLTDAFKFLILNNNEYELELEHDSKFLPDFKYKSKHKFGNKITTDNFQITVIRIDSINDKDINDDLKLLKGAYPLFLSS